MRRRSLLAAAAALPWLAGCERAPAEIDGGWVGADAARGHALRDGRLPRADAGSAQRCTVASVGLYPDVLFDVITSGAASSDLLLARGRDMLNSNFSPKGPVILANKDLALSLETGKRLGVVLPVGALYQQLLLKAHYNGWDREDATVVMRIYQQLAERTAKAKKSVPKRK